MTVPWQGKASQVVTVKNTGSEPAKVTLGEQFGGLSSLTAHGAPTMRIKGTFSPLSLDHKNGSRGKATGAKPNISVPAAGPWTSIADFPAGPIEDNDVVVLGGKIYSVFGVADSGAKDPFYHGMYVYDPTAGSWLPRQAGPQDVRQKPAMAALNGKIYATGGWGFSGNLDPKTEVYDPAQNAWTIAAANPAPRAGSGVAVLGGKMYVVGGCPKPGYCGSTDNMVYDPVTDSWSRGADYPEQVAWESCGAIFGELYCAGGENSHDGATLHTYVYDPATNAWTRVADMPIDLWSSGYTTAEGRLLISGGVTGHSRVITNQGVSYDPASDTWTPIPNSNIASYRGGSTCGFYKIGGHDPKYGLVPWSEVLPGMADCGEPKDVSWLAATPRTLTIAPGASAQVTVTVNANVADITQPGTYTAAFVIAPDTPYATPNVPVSMTVNPPKTWGKITGTVSGPSGPIPGATVQINTEAGHYTLRTDASGHYQLWLDAQNPLQVICADNGYQSKVRRVTIRKGATTTLNFALRKV
jgi:N-acetylneuraminic acid mutarotase